MLYRETFEGFVPWRGERLDGVLYPLTIEGMWSESDLAGIGLYHPAPAVPVPEDKVVLRSSVQRVEGVVRFVNELADMPPAVPIQPTPSLLACGVFTVADGWVESIGAASGIAMVFPVEPGMFWLFFTEPQPDLSYATYVSCSQGQINVSTRTLDYVELCVKEGGAPIDPAEFSVNIVRSV